MNTIIAPSILSADFTRLGEEINDVINGGAEWLHIDVMDGIFVPNISIGIPVIESIRKNTEAFLDVHLMIDRPHRYIKNFADAGADLICFHVEADQPQDILEAIKECVLLGKKVGVALKPKTPAHVILPYLDLLDMVLIMTVEPGFGGQKFMKDQIQKIALIRTWIDEINPDCRLEVDGGIDPVTSPVVREAGADTLVAGSAVFKKTNRREAIALIRGEDTED